jgi:hypothetical protein
MGVELGVSANEYVLEGHRYQLARKPRKPIELSFRRPELECNVFSTTLECAPRAGQVEVSDLTA